MPGLTFLAQAAAGGPAPAVHHLPWTHPWLWGGFLVFMLIAMTVDLVLLRRARGGMSTRSAAIWSAVWIGLALVFNGILWATLGTKVAEEFLAGYLLEESLSVDNLFVFVLVFAFFRTPPKEQRRVLVWGILGAMILRAAMILLGAALIQRFHYTLAFFGFILLYSGIKLLFHDEDADPGKSRIVRILRRILPMTKGSFTGIDANDPAASASARASSYGYRGSHFFVHEDGRWRCTPLFLVLLVIEGSDVVFAVDSVPAIFGVTEDPFIVFTSNMFAILGLRALFFLIAAAIQRLRYLNYGLSMVLTFIGVKMLLPFLHEFVLHRWQYDIQIPGLGAHLHVSVGQSLFMICAILGGTAVWSLVATRGDATGGDATGGDATGGDATGGDAAEEPPAAPEPASAEPEKEEPAQAEPEQTEAANADTHPEGP